MRRLCVSILLCILFVQHHSLLADDTQKGVIVAVLSKSADLMTEQTVVATVKKGIVFKSLGSKPGWVAADIHGAKGWFSEKLVSRLTTTANAEKAGTKSDDTGQAELERFFTQAAGGDTYWLQIDNVESMCCFRRQVESTLVRRAFGAPDCIVKDAKCFRPVPPGMKPWFEKVRGERWYYGKIAVWVPPDGRIRDFIYWKNFGDPPPSWPDYETK